MSKNGINKKLVSGLLALVILLVAVSAFLAIRGPEVRIVEVERTVERTVTVTVTQRVMEEETPMQLVKIKVGRTTGASGFHIPSYVAMERGFFRKAGLDAEFVALTGGELVRATIAKEIDFTPIPGGGSQAMLQGAPLIFVVGESLISQWTITTSPDIEKVEDLRGKTLGLGRPGSADYTEVVAVLKFFFNMEPGRDYKVISFRGEPDRIAALIRGDIQGAALSFPHAARAEAEGFKILLRTGDYLPRLGGTFHTHVDNVRERPEVVKQFIKAIAWAIDYIYTQPAGTIEVIQKYFNIEDPKIAERIYNQVRFAYSPDIPPDLLRKLFETRARLLEIPEEEFAKMDLEKFVARDLLNEVLRELGKKL